MDELTFDLPKNTENVRSPSSPITQELAKVPATLKFLGPKFFTTVQPKVSDQSLDIVSELDESFVESPQKSRSSAKK
jgi:hypothetical protein